MRVYQFHHFGSIKIVTVKPECFQVLPKGNEIEIDIFTVIMIILQTLQTLFFFRSGHDRFKEGKRLPVKCFKSSCLIAGVAQLVEHNLAKVGVAGPNPVARSITKTK